MDYGARKQVVTQVLTLLDAGDMLPSVPLDDYLSGNTDDASLGKGMARDFNLNDYADSLRALAARPEVTEIWVEVHELPDVSEPADDDMWAQAFKVHVVTSLSTEAVRRELGLAGAKGCERWVGCRVWCSGARGAAQARTPSDPRRVWLTRRLRRSSRAPATVPSARAACSRYSARSGTRAPQPDRPP